MSARPGVEAYLARLAPESRELIDALRSVVIESCPGLEERIKWNAPSFAVEDEDRITLGIERKGGARVVLHRGARTKCDGGFSFADEEGLADWPAPDRAVIRFSDIGDVSRQRDSLRNLFARWIAATS